MSDGRFKKGEHRSSATEFKPGQHWRKPQPYWDKEWLEQQYLTCQRSASDIAAEFGIKTNGILFWLDKHQIPRRTMAETRTIKKWGITGSANGMYGRTGAQNPHWKGGITAERQTFYVSEEWKRVVPLVWKRDNATCQRCDLRSDGKTKFHIHHIVSFQVKALRAVLSNLVLLCEPCHNWVHSRANTTKAFIERRGGHK